MQAVRKADHDRYLAALYAPSDKRDALMALYAFNAEIAGVRDRIREALPGEVRLQWWRDVLGAPAGEEETGQPVAPVAYALRAAIAQYHLPLAAFQNYLEARVFDLYDDPMPSRTDLEGYCGETASTIIQLASLMLDASAAQKFSQLAGHAGCAQAMTGLLLLLPRHRARGQCYIPADLLAAVGSSPEEFIKGQDRQGSLRVVGAMIALAKEHLEMFHKEASFLPQSLRPAYLPLALTAALLQRMEARPQDVLDGKTGLSHLYRHWLLWRHAMRGWR
ncbi:phytoene/squalene synthase family protein [Aquamicrobium segne]|uniref:Phytoene/squalene synthase family protein n=1 Tax=Aquamicrobium segne TaxID=469547 RepID=A0ABW0GX30_9HYPH